MNGAKVSEILMTIIQVTHNEKYASYGSRIVKLEDGLVRADDPVKKMVI